MEEERGQGDMGGHEGEGDGDRGGSERVEIVTWGSLFVLIRVEGGCEGEVLT